MNRHTATEARWICPDRACLRVNGLPHPLAGGRRWSGVTACPHCGKLARLTGLSLYDAGAPAALLAFEVREANRAS